MWYDSRLTMEKYRIKASHLRMRRLYSHYEAKGEKSSFFSVVFPDIFFKMSTGMYAVWEQFECKEGISLDHEVLEALQPAEVFRYFGELSKIPRGSGNEKEVSDYLVGFARERGLEVMQDEAYNVVIKKPGTRGYEDSPTVILQGHMDMVCEKAPDSDHDFTKDPLRLRVVDGDWLYATDTTLGGDNGIAVAMGMALIASENIPHPPIELLVTTSEETGMDGAMALDASSISGKTLINIDSEEEGVLTVSCAGGCSAHVCIPLSWESVPEGSVALAMDIKGMLGGHSGIEINKGRANANKLLGRLLYKAGDKVRLASVGGGNKHNAIPREARALVVVDSADVDVLKEVARELEETARGEYRTADPGISITVTPVDKAPEQVMERRCAENVVRFLFLVPNSVQSMSADIPGLVESSLNLGIVRTEADAVDMLTSIRSSVGSLKQNIYDTVAAIGALSGAEMSVEGQYPEWQYDPDSKLREICIEQYEALFGQKPGVAAIHAGLECALFAEKFNGTLDMISIGPDMVDVHTAQEHLSIPSTLRTWDYLLAVLKALK